VVCENSGINETTSEQGRKCFLLAGTYEEGDLGLKMEVFTVVRINIIATGVSI
jgi:hypothetical protein